MFVKMFQDKSNMTQKSCLILWRSVKISESYNLCIVQSWNHLLFKAPGVHPMEDAFNGRKLPSFNVKHSSDYQSILRKADFSTKYWDKVQLKGDQFRGSGTLLSWSTRDIICLYSGLWHYGRCKGRDTRTHPWHLRMCGLDSDSDVLLPSVFKHRLFDSRFGMGKLWS